jgi:hypothetical protein
VAEAKSTGSVPHGRDQRVLTTSKWLHSVALDPVSWSSTAPRAECSMFPCRRLSSVTALCRPRQVSEVCSRSRPAEKGSTCSMVAPRPEPDTAASTEAVSTTALILSCLDRLKRCASSGTPMTRSSPTLCRPSIAGERADRISSAGFCEVRLQPGHKTSGRQR